MMPPPSAPPPPYESIDGLDKMAEKSGSKWNPRNGSKLAILVAVIAAILVIVAGIVGAVLGTRANEYPDSSALSYTLADTYAGTDFFDDFDYFTGYVTQGS